jgi:hypothetical protein
MFAVPLGIVGAGIAAGVKADSASSMAGMSDMSNMGGATAHAPPLPMWLTLLDRYGPELLVASVFLMVGALAVRRSIVGAMAALAGGIVQFYGMYGQSNMTVMWSATIVGMRLLLASLYALLLDALRSTGAKASTTRSSGS